MDILVSEVLYIIKSKTIIRNGTSEFSTVYSAAVENHMALAFEREVVSSIMKCFSYNVITKL